MSDTSDPGIFGYDPRMGAEALVGVVQPGDGDAIYGDPAAAVEEVEPAQAETKPAEAEIKATRKAFDPAEHNVKQVLKHVKRHPDSAGEILAAEIDGKARKGIIDALTEE